MLHGLRGLIRHHVAHINRIEKGSRLASLRMTVAVMYCADVVLTCLMELSEDDA